MLQKQLESLKFTYKISRSHLFFQVMQFNGDASAIQFHYNATKDCFASSPTGMNYYTFVSRNKDKITTIKNNHLVPPQSATSEQPWPASDLPPLVDQRLALSEEEFEQDEEVTTRDVTISDLTKEKDKD